MGVWNTVMITLFSNTWLTCIWIQSHNFLIRLLCRTYFALKKPKSMLTQNFGKYISLKIWTYDTHVQCKIFFKSIFILHTSS
jgi:hypothetical protein